MTTFDSLHSTNAINGRVYLLLEETQLNGHESSYALTYRDTVGDYGDTYDSTDRALLAKGLPIIKTDGRTGTKRVIRCMVTATRRA